MGAISSKGKRILIVEDELLLSLYEEQLLHKIGCTVVGKVTTGEEAISMFEKVQPDLLLIDIGLGGPMDGVQVIKKIREISEIPAIVISGEPNHLVHTLSYQKGYTELLRKPFSGTNLLDTVERLLNKDQ